MRALRLIACVVVALASASAHAHGPQIQITNDNNKIVTRRLLKDGPYSSAITAPTVMYVIPVELNQGVWLSQPNNAIDPITMGPAFLSGPGLAYGHDLADGGPQLFEAGSVLSVRFVSGLERWNGAAFVDAGATELKGFRGSNAGISSPPENFAVTSDGGPFDSVSLPAVAETYGTEDEEVHNSLRWALLGDGSSPTSAAADGVYLVGLQVMSSQAGLDASEPFLFMLHKNAPVGAVSAAVNYLLFPPSVVQIVPEPSGLLLAALATFGCYAARDCRALSRPRRAI